MSADNSEAEGYRFESCRGYLRTNIDEPKADGERANEKRRQILKLRGAVGLAHLSHNADGMWTDEAGRGGGPGFVSLWRAKWRERGQYFDRERPFF